MSYLKHFLLKIVIPRGIIYADLSYEFKNESKTADMSRNIRNKMSFSGLKWIY